jgi:nucleoside phosphorylase
MTPPDGSGSSVPRPVARAAFPGEWLICFAVKEEAQRFAVRDPSVRTLITGMGRVNSERAALKAIQERRPSLVLTCGFAGALTEGLSRGTVLFSDDADPRIRAVLEAASARSAKFHCADRVAVTAAEKRALREQTRADAVEMESQHICALCRERQIPCATVRVILDTADEDLPLDFNQLMTDDHTLNFMKLAVELARSPGKIKALIQLQKQSRAAAESLATVLHRLAG